MLGPVKGVADVKKVDIVGLNSGTFTFIDNPTKTR